ncbi:hypothetical protein MPNTM1_01022 [Mycolicibacterium parafortuitum]|uniref:hypothetical protein n=1 Tax=Mycolicibacterium parafortuitum TaxID=39692 RepID=UPI0032C45CD4
MKKIGLLSGLLSVTAGALSAAVIGFAGPAQADGPGPVFGGQDDRAPGIGWTGPGWGGTGFGFGYGRDSNNPWLGQLYPRVKVPQVDTSVRN